MAFLLFPTVLLAQTPESRIDAAMSRARQGGIPVSLLESKIAEGRAKGVNMDRIAAAVENRLQGLEKAQTAMKKVAPDVDAAQLSVGADAISAGVSDAVLEKITGATGRERRAVAIAALTQLVANGTAPEAALLRVQDALSRGPQALANLAAQSGAAGSRGATTRENNPGVGNARGNSGPPGSVTPPGQTDRPAPPGNARGRGQRGPQ
jgi:hypothetical protein